MPPPAPLLTAIAADVSILGLMVLQIVDTVRGPSLVKILTVCFSSIPGLVAMYIIPKLVKHVFEDPFGKLKDEIITVRDTIGTRMNSMKDDLQNTVTSSTSTTAADMAAIKRDLGRDMNAMKAELRNTVTSSTSATAADMGAI